jgi:hypothetical protein
MEICQVCSVIHFPITVADAVGRHLYLDDRTASLVRLYHSFHYPFDDDEWPTPSVLQLFPRLEILSIAIVNDISDEQQDRKFEVLRQRRMAITLFKAVTVNELQSVTLHFEGNPKSTCVCFFDVPLVPSLGSRYIRVCHVIDLDIWPGAGLLASAVEDRSVSPPGLWLPFDTANPLQLDFREPADEELARSTLSIVMNLARVVKLSPEPEYGELSILGGPRILDIFHDFVSLHIFASPKAHMICIVAHRKTSDRATRHRSQRGLCLSSDHYAPPPGHRRHIFRKVVLRSLPRGQAEIPLA